jgi:hypothetical protein
MSGYIYRFQSVSAQPGMSPSLRAEKILMAATYYVRGIRFYELTDRKNPYPLYAVVFTHNAAKHYFEEVFECLLERSGLHADILKPIEGESLTHVDPSSGAANATDFEQRQVVHGDHHPVPPSLKEWVRTRSK